MSREPKSIELSIILLPVIILSFLIGMGFGIWLKSLEKPDTKYITSCENDTIYPYYYEQRKRVDKCRELGGYPRFSFSTGELDECIISGGEFYEK